jgi:hypothetical protein
MKLKIFFKVTFFSEKYELNNLICNNLFSALEKVILLTYVTSRRRMGEHGVSEHIFHRPTAHSSGEAIIQAAFNFPDFSATHLRLGRTESPEYIRKKFAPIRVRTHDLLVAGECTNHYVIGHSLSDRN